MIHQSEDNQQQLIVNEIFQDYFHKQFGILPSNMTYTELLNECQIRFSFSRFLEDDAQQLSDKLFYGSDVSFHNYSVQNRFRHLELPYKIYQKYVGFGPSWMCYLHTRLLKPGETLNNIQLRCVQRVYNTHSIIALTPLPKL